MKMRHAAALALVGWYLMLPPETLTGSVLRDSPRHHYPGWTIKAEFKSYEDCDIAQRKLVAQAMRHSLDLPVDQVARDDNLKKIKSRCVSEELLQHWKKLDGIGIPID